ncbi:MAG: primosomal protein N' [Clostridia bacterium]|nr:primosomal protein N' [Clostridia bacterium]
MVVKVLVDTSIKTLNKIYDYLVPEELVSEVAIGKRVYINFGKGKGQEKEGIIVKIISDEENTSSVKLKSIVEVLDSESYIDEKKLKLAKWISKVYFCNVYDALKLMLPPSQKGNLEKKELNGRQAKIICLAKSSEEIESKIQSGEIKSARHIKMLKYLMENEYIFLDDAIKTLDISRTVINTVEKNGFIAIDHIDIQNEDYSNVERTEKLKATDEQEKVINCLIDRLNRNEFNVSLLKGVTGSGKTEVYLQAIEECIRLGKTAIVLVPEISLTFQTKRRFIGRFGDMVSLLHSKMTILERQTEIKRIINGKSKIVIGPRSALFVPLKNIGLVVIDEEHDTSYISQTTPKYSAKEVATRLCYLNNAVLLLGSATPEVSTMYKAKAGRIDLYELNNRPGKFTLPSVEIVDMKEEKLLGNKGYISGKLLYEIKDNIDKGQQTFIFLNRRGYASNVICKSCGRIIKCMNCDVGLTYHKKINLLLCHYCSYAESLKNTCPYCKAENIELLGAGTENIEQELKEAIPGISIIRMDADTTVKRGSHEEILKRFSEEKINVLVGTQMISKGHDIENVSLVGIINADSTIAGNSFSSGERGFSNLLQVSGRAGRGKIKGRVIVQAYDTENYVIESLEKQSYEDFYNKEIEFRKMSEYPPFKDIVLIEFSSKFKNELQTSVNKAHMWLVNNKIAECTITSPKAPYISKVNNNYILQIVLKANLNDKVYDYLYKFLQEYDKINKKDVKISIIKNPIYI